MSYLSNIKKKASQVNARELVIFSLPKIGKTELCTHLPGDYLILDFENGTDYYDSNAICIDSLEVLDAVSKEFLETKPKFNFIVIDTLTSMYNKIINAIAVRDYNKEENKNKPASFDISKLTYGVGYTYKRNATQKVIDFFKRYCDTIIILGHVADKAITGNDGNTLQVKDLDIEGKLKNILAAKVDAIALLKRVDANTNVLSFDTAESNTTGSRMKHLSGKEIVISKRKEDGSLETYWDEVFLS